jgi:fucose permease
MPLVYGHYADLYNLKSAYWVLLPCYLYLVFYAVHGHRVRSWTR